VGLRIRAFDGVDEEVRSVEVDRLVDSIGDRE